MYPDTLLASYNVLNDPNAELNRQVRTYVSSYNSAWDPLFLCIVAEPSLCEV
jgi:hypothetical protein